MWAGKDEKGNDLPDRRKVSKLPYHLTKGCVWARAEEILTSLRFIEAKCKAGMTYELVKDYDVAMNEIPEGRDEREAEQRREKKKQSDTHMKSLNMRGSGARRVTAMRKTRRNTP